LYSWNLSKILHLSFWRQLVKALCVLAVPAVIYMGVLNGKVVACMPVVDVDPATGELLLRARDAAACSALSALEPIACESLENGCMKVQLGSLMGVSWAAFHVASVPCCAALLAWC